MADYLIKGETLTNIADEVRELSGTTIPKTTSSMLSDINAANTEISSQSNIIDQILSAVDELPEAGSGSETVVETCNVTIDATRLPDGEYLMLWFTDGDLQSVQGGVDNTYSPEETTLSVLKDSIILILSPYDVKFRTTSSDNVLGLANGRSANPHGFVAYSDGSITIYTEEV